MESIVVYLLTFKINRFKREDSEKMQLIYLSNVSKTFSFDKIKKTELSGYIYNFSVDYDSVGVDDFLDIHKYLM